MIKSMTGTIRVTMNDGTEREYTVSSPSQMVYLGGRLAKNDILLDEYLEAFLAECIDFSREHTRAVQGREIEESFKRWCEYKKTLCFFGRNTLYRKLEGMRGVIRTNPHNKTAFRGLKLLDFNKAESNQVDSDLI